MSWLFFGSCSYCPNWCCSICWPALKRCVVYADLHGSAAKMHCPSISIGKELVQQHNCTPATASDSAGYLQVESLHLLKETRHQLPGQSPSFHSAYKESTVTWFAGSPDVTYARPDQQPHAKCLRECIQVTVVLLLMCTWELTSGLVKCVK